MIIDVTTKYRVILKKTRSNPPENPQDQIESKIIFGATYII